MRKQLAFILARAQIPQEWITIPPPSGDDIDVEVEPEELDEDLLGCLSHSNLSNMFKTFGKEMAVDDAKSLDDVYKSHLEGSRVCPVILFFVGRQVIVLLILGRWFCS